MKKTLTIFTILLITALSSLNAQTFPVQVNTQLMPPYSIYLADYVAPGSERLAVNIFLRDINRPELRVKLRIRIEGQGVVLQTKQGYLPPALSLQGGLSERLISADLADYFNPNNLDFTGISKRQFLQTGALPQGVYRFTVEVLEYNRSVKVSNSGTAIAWLILNDPPLINNPKMAEKVRAQYPQYMTFQWTPRHTGSPNSAFNTEYDFRMVEIWPEGRNPNDAMRTSNTFFEQTTQNTSLIYGIAEPALIPGRSYAFQVKAKSIVGIDELDLFKNNGYSQVHTFTFGDACLAPTELVVEDVTNSKIKLSWKGVFNQTGYTVSYREANDPDAEWFQEETFFTDHTIVSLKEDTEYELQVLSACGTLTGEETDLVKTITEAPSIVDLQCGLPPENFTFDNNTPLSGLTVGDRVMAGDFDVKVTKIEGSNGTYSGDGTMVLPLMNNVKVKVKFRNIKVNEEYRMTMGDMEVIGAALDLLPDEVIALIDDLNETLDEIDDALDDASDVLEDIEDAIDIVDNVLDEIAEYLPDDIVQEIEDAKAEIAAAKQAMGAATTDQAKADAKVEVKEARGRLKDGVKKAVDYYAKAIKQFIEILTKSFKELGKEVIAGEEETSNELSSTEDGLSEYIATSNQTLVQGLNSGDSSSFEFLDDYLLESIDASQLSSEISQNTDLKEYHDKTNSYLQTLRKKQLETILKILASDLSNDTVKDLAEIMEANGLDIIKKIAQQLKERREKRDIIDQTKEDIKNNFNELINYIIE